MIFPKNFARNYEKDNTWNIRRLVDESLVLQATQCIILKIVGFFNLPVFCNVGREFIRNLSKWKNIEVSSTKPGSSTVMFIKTLQIVTIAYNEFITWFHESLIYENWYFSMEFVQVQLNKYETGPNSI